MAIVIILSILVGFLSGVLTIGSVFAYLVYRDDIAEMVKKDKRVPAVQFYDQEKDTNSQPTLSILQ